MAIKNILLHLTSSDKDGNRADVTIDLAESLGARVVCLFVDRGEHHHAFAGRGASAAYSEEIHKQELAARDQILNHINTLASKKGVSVSCVTETADHLNAILEYVHAVDLTVVGQPHFDSLDDRFRFRLPEEIIQHAGGLVLVVPENNLVPNLCRPRHALVAWNYSAEATRAVRAALPLLELAEQVTLCTLEEDDHIPADHILKFFEAHGIRPTHLRAEPKTKTANAILDFAKQADASVIIAGAYGKGAFTERFMRGTTRTLLEESELPILTCH